MAITREATKAIVCDSCHEAETGFAAECEDGCPRDLDHAGLCMDDRRDWEGCATCGTVNDRMHVSGAEQRGQAPKESVLCDSCQEEETGFPAECEDGCPRDLDHPGLCLDARSDGEACGRCGATGGRLHQDVE